MTLLFCDGFDAVDDGIEMNKKWSLIDNTGAIVLSPSYAYAGKGRGLKSSTWIRKYNLPNVPTFVAGIYVCPTAIGIYTPFSFLDSNNLEQVSVRTDSAGRIQVSRNGTAVATSTNAMSANQWYHIEFKCTIHNVTGSYQVKVNGVDWIPQATGNTRAQTNNYMAGMALVGNQSMYVDDFYLLDCASAPNDDFLGPTKILTLFPESAGNYSQWASNWGGNLHNVNKMQDHDDTIYNQSNTVGQIDTFKITGVAGANIKALALNLISRQEPAATRTIARVIRQNSTDSVGTAFAPAVGYGTQFEALDTNPVTGSGWTSADIDAMEVGYKVIS